jgi:hypothetical protein
VALLAEQIVVVGSGCIADEAAAEAMKLDDIATIGLDDGMKMDDVMDGCDAITLVIWTIVSVLVTGPGSPGVVCGGCAVVEEGSAVVVVVGGASVVVVVVVGTWVVVVVVDVDSGVGVLVPGSEVAEVESSAGVLSVVPESLEVTSVFEVF